MNNTISIDSAAYGILVGDDIIGEGSYRRIYDCKLRDDAVVKIERYSSTFHNILEWKIWEEVKDNKIFSKWFAPCLHISPCGTILIQARTSPLRTSEIPPQVPNIFCDLKMSNWGIFEGRPVCHDYGITNVMKRGLHKPIMLTVDPTNW